MDEDDELDEDEELGPANEAAANQPLVLAAEQGQLNDVLAALEAGADIEVAGGQFFYTALTAACSHGHLAIVQLLVERGADLEAENGAGDTPLIYAASHGHLDVVNYLLTCDVDLVHENDARQTALMWAAWTDHIDVCKALLAAGADLMASDLDGFTALSHYGGGINWNTEVEPLPFPDEETVALRREELEKAFALGPHPSQVQRRRDEAWTRRGPLVTVLAEHGLRPLRRRATEEMQRQFIAALSDAARVRHENSELRQLLAAALAGQAVVIASIPPPPPEDPRLHPGPRSATETAFSQEGLARHIVLFL